MHEQPFPVIDLAATGQNILHLRLKKGLTVRDMQAFFRFEEPRAIYKWQSGQSLPTVDNLLGLSWLLGVTIEEILVSTPPPRSRRTEKAVPAAAGAAVFLLYSAGVPFTRRAAALFSGIPWA